MADKPPAMDVAPIVVAGNQENVDTSLEDRTLSESKSRADLIKTLADRDQLLFDEVILADRFMRRLQRRITDTDDMNNDVRCLLLAELALTYVGLAKDASPSANDVDVPLFEHLWHTTMGFHTLVKNSIELRRQAILRAHVDATAAVAAAKKRKTEEDTGAAESAASAGQAAPNNTEQ